ncbi:sigma-54-dependent Fis family transcriptional regulator [Budviciaceae bacterium CWB-B4]|uniref:Sigma-54-dependent Fis family transcriptional regulator n=1 Tax=Limnobaculum xujianqingii TaxID=2738837 RepID=A0A9D7AIU4_9GAMM|nr:sigma-54 dependent transcriptional regulator [Limnobaculum xujianqingii]MBK5073330.1 sigma-54-dependent Fis family transcriptional regulator [Limnobaculum xujianqingii]MBK5176939.1 sigma-54-dependent Fis family transcriptional regulator [Limnobaculum xujianqingii]
MNIEVIIIDDEPCMTESLAEMLTIAGFLPRAFGQARHALEYLALSRECIVLSDIRMPEMDGLALLSAIQQLDSQLPVILMSGHADIPLAIQAMKQGAQDFLEKPIKTEQLFQQLHLALNRRQAYLQMHHKPADNEYLTQKIIGRSSAIQHLRQQVSVLAQAQVDTLIYGETGSGKDVVAEAIHHSGPRTHKSFIAINCGAMPENLLESELFGHEAGSFTGAQKRHIGKIEAANGGTLFLDEIESMPLAAQIRLLRVLQTRTIERVGSHQLIPVDIHVLAASKMDLTHLSRQGLFRSDLLYRLNVANLHIPPLRERENDILLLFEYFCQQAARQYQREIPSIKPSQQNKLLNYLWPGNVRELINVANRYVLGISGDGINLNEDNLSAIAESELNDLEYHLDSYEKSILISTLETCAGELSEVAMRLNLTRKTLYRKMKKHGLDKRYFQDLDGTMLSS